MSTIPPPDTGRDDTGGNDVGRNDVEKRWDDPPTFRAAMFYVAGVVVVAAVAATIYLAGNRASLLLASMVPGVCLLGAIGALIQGYRTYRRGGTWVIWQGAA